MRVIIKSCITKTISFIVFLLRETLIGRFVLEVVIHKLMNHVVEVNHKGKMFLQLQMISIDLEQIPFRQRNPILQNGLIKYLKILYFWDIGANVGLYSIYAAK